MNSDHRGETMERIQTQDDAEIRDALAGVAYADATPGPWTLKEANTTIPIVGANGKTVASVKYRENDLADARLIAAAPELLAALREMLRCYTEPSSTALVVNGAYRRASADKARAAIAKAVA